MLRKGAGEGQAGAAGPLAHKTGHFGGGGGGGGSFQRVQ